MHPLVKRGGKWVLRDWPLGRVLGRDWHRHCWCIVICCLLGLVAGRAGLKLAGVQHDRDLEGQSPAVAGQMVVWVALHLVYVVLIPRRQPVPMHIIVIRWVRRLPPYEIETIWGPERMIIGIALRAVQMIFAPCPLRKDRVSVKLRIHWVISSNILAAYLTAHDAAVLSQNRQVRNKTRVSWYQFRTHHRNMRGKIHHQPSKSIQDRTLLGSLQIQSDIKSFSGIIHFRDLCLIFILIVI